MPVLTFLMSGCSNKKYYPPTNINTSNTYPSLGQSTLNEIKSPEIIPSYKNTQKYGCDTLNISELINLKNLNLYKKRYAFLKNGKNDPDGPYTISVYSYKALAENDSLYKIIIDGNYGLDTSEIFVELNNDSRFVNLAKQIGCPNEAPKSLKLK